MSSTLRRNRLITLVAAVAMVVVICGYASHDLASHADSSCHCDWSLHFTGVAGSAPHPLPIVKPILAAWVAAPATAVAPRRARRMRAHLARAPPRTLSIG